MPASGSRSAARLVLDSSAYSHLRGNDERVIDSIAKAHVVLIPVVVIGELEGGFAAGSRTKENQLRLDEFLMEPFVEIVGVDRDIARRYGQIYGQLRRAGTPVSTNDMWIAATTLSIGGHLLSFDDDFQRVKGLECTVLKP